MSTDAMDLPPVVSAEEWDAAREGMLAKEKELTHHRDRVAAERRRMPRMKVDKDYRFEGPDGPVGLLDLFDGRSQLIVYRFFYGPEVEGWPEIACVGCSMGADQLGHLAHLNARDTTLVYASRADQGNIAGLKQKMGWETPWYTITDGFDDDFGIRDWHGTNVFLRDGDDVYRTYFVDSRGDEGLSSIWTYLDITPFGRQEKWEDSPAGYPQTEPYGWWKRHDEYDGTESPAAQVAAEGADR